MRERNWDVVGLIDDTVYIVTEPRDGEEYIYLKCWSRGEGVTTLQSAHPGTIDDFAVIHDKLYFVYSPIDPGPDNPEALYSGSDTEAFVSITANQHIIDAYQDWFA